MKSEELQTLMQDLFDSLPGQSVFGKKISKIPLEYGDMSVPVRMLLSRLRSWGLMEDKDLLSHLKSEIKRKDERIKALESQVETLEAQLSSSDNTDEDDKDKPVGWVYTP